LQLHILAVDLQIGNAFGIEGAIDHREANIFANLWRSESYTIGIGHRFEHIGHEGAQRVVDFGYGAAALAENGVTVLNNFADHGVA
jgi:hypothetical protein